MHRRLFGRTASALLTGLLLLHAPALVRAEEKVTFETFDKVELQGTWYPGNKEKKAPTALLIHKIGGDRRQLEPLAEKLNEAGFSVLNLDLRGHGDSTSIKAAFWMNPVNQRSFPGVNPLKKDSIDVKEFKAAYLPYLVNDLAAAKLFLEKKNNAEECNVGDLVIVGADDGGTLAALWLGTEWDRRKVVNGRPDEPEGKDIAAAAFLSIRPNLGGGKRVLPANQALQLVLQGAGIQSASARQGLHERTGYGFFYGAEDAEASRLAGDLYGNVLAADKNKLKMTYKIELKKTKLGGADLLGKEGLETEDLVVRYFTTRVLAVRKGTAWEKREVKDFVVQEVPLRAYSGLVLP